MAIAGGLLLICQTLLQADPPSPVQPNSFDGTPIGARPVAMGEAFVAVGGTPEVPYWNPAGLNRLPRNLFTIMLEGPRRSALPIAEVEAVQPLQGRKLAYLAFAGRQGALSYRPLANQRDRVVQNPANPDANVKETKYQVNAFTLSAASERSERSLLGFNVTYLNGHASLTQVKEGESPIARSAAGHGVSLDVGLLMTLHPDVHLGIVGQNIPGYLWWDDFARDRLPPVLRTGMAVQIPTWTIVTFDYEKRFYAIGPAQPDFLHAGLEVSPWQVIAFRGGISGDDWNDPNQVRYTAGVGIRKGPATLDVALRTFQLSSGSAAKAVHEYVTSLSLPF